MLEERLDEGAYSVRESSGLTVPPAPLAAVHPELEAVIDQSLKQFRRSWLSDESSLDITLSPPWGSAWLVPTGNLPEEDIEDQVIWELQQRLDSSLEEYIYAWHPLDEQAYAIVIRPELLAFWDHLAKANDLEIGSITLLAGLVEPAIERGADLMPLFHLWSGRSVQSGNGSDRFGESTLDIDDAEEDLDLDTGVTEEYRPEDVADDEEADEALRALIGDGDSKPGRKRTKTGGGVRKRLLPLAIVVLLLAIAAGAILMRDRLPFIQQALDKVAGSGETAPQQVAEAPAQTEDAGFTIRTVDLQEVPLPPELASTGGMLGTLYDLADQHNVNLFSTILQGGSVELEAVGDPESIQSWRAAVSGVRNAPAISMGEQATLAPGVPIHLTLEASAEDWLTQEQFTDLVHSLGIEDHGKHAFRADRDAMTRLLSVLRGERRRPFRLSIHHVPGDRYLLVMFP
ncbi:hypothetical protein KQI63_14825 [bacterium]|nr:hypothetical protein [bacterium]